MLAATAARKIIIRKIFEVNEKAFSYPKEERKKKNWASKLWKKIKAIFQVFVDRFSLVFLVVDNLATYWTHSAVKYICLLIYMYTHSVNYYCERDRWDWVEWESFVNKWIFWMLNNCEILFQFSFNFFSSIIVLRLWVMSRILIFDSKMSSFP